MSLSIAETHGARVMKVPKTLQLDYFGSPYGELELSIPSYKDGVYKAGTDANHKVTFRIAPGKPVFHLHTLSIRSLNAVGYTIEGKGFLGGTTGTVVSPTWDISKNTELTVASGDAQKIKRLKIDEGYYGDVPLIVLTATGPTTFYIQALEE